ncbi:hypothetical protein M9H77_32962 [Catharanthus roseus]|uniref:Uncharacterized protein n=1 Tax=Catharanthus roseus TaxID=4058 RepID=A0ACC0A697_CATRO|nr:hypothetical protein M9H77_32962 [Catharanthus roseus]
MAAAVCSNGNGTHAKTESKIRLEAMQTVIPMKPTDPRSSIPVFTSAAGSGSAGVYKRTREMNIPVLLLLVGLRNHSEEHYRNNRRSPEDLGKKTAVPVIMENWRLFRMIPVFD